MWSWPVCRTFHVLAQVVAKYEKGVGRKDGDRAFIHKLREVRKQYGADTQ